MQKSLFREAYEAGKVDRARGRLRASPFYGQTVVVRGGKKMDVTPMLDAGWYAGYDGEQLPSDALDAKTDALPAE